MSALPRIVLITSGLRRVAHFFPELSGQPVGIINWNNAAPASPSALTQHALTRKIYAKLRRREYANLQHLCSQNDLLFADVHKNDGPTLQKTLQEWECNLVITSNCSFVPTGSLAHLTHGSINMHPSWLPEYRGGEPVLWQVMAGEPMLATTIHRLSDEYDTGGIVAQDKHKRPTGASQALLADITEVKLGKALLNVAIERITKTPDYAGSEQPEESSTPYAYRKNADKLANEKPLSEFKPETLWDVLHYYGHCPASWLKIDGWRKKLTWQPVLFETSSANNLSGISAGGRSAPTTADLASEWQVKKQGLKITLVCGDATITLKPKISLS